MKRFLIVLRRFFVLALLAAGVYGAAQVPLPRLELPPRDGLALGAVAAWGYQLQNARADRIAAGIDLLVIDAQRPSGLQRVLSFEEVERFRTRPDGSRRIVLAYLSIGEAESYRPYWWSHWRVFKPAWLGPENKVWRTNYHVRYWDSAWRRLMVDRWPSMLDRAIDLVWSQRRPAIDQILDAGFDGVYLDRVDAFDEWQASNPNAQAAMIDFVGEISDYARKRRPGFLIVPQNAEELLANATYRRKIDAIAKEDLFYGNDHKANANKADEVAESTRWLQSARADGKPVFLVEYLDAADDKRRQAAARARAQGFVLQFADRALNAPPEPPRNDAPRNVPSRNDAGSTPNAVPPAPAPGPARPRNAG